MQLKERFPHQPQAVKILMSLMASPISRLLAIPFYAFANPIRMGTNMTIFARFRKKNRTEEAYAGNPFGC